MKHIGTKRIFKSPFYVNFKKHYCPECDKRLEKIRVSKIINSNSFESEMYDFSSGDNFMSGNVKFIFTEFRCPVCGKQFSIDEMKHIENKHS